MKKYETPECEVITLCTEHGFVSSYDGESYYRSNYKNPCENCSEQFTNAARCKSCIYWRN